MNLVLFPQIKSNKRVTAVRRHPQNHNPMVHLELDEGELLGIELKFQAGARRPRGGAGTRTHAMRGGAGGG